MMNEEYIKRLDFDSDTFEAMKTDMNFILQRMIGSMIEKDSTEGSMTIKIDVNMVTEWIPNNNPDVEGETRMIRKPQEEVRKQVFSMKVELDKTGMVHLVSGTYPSHDMQEALQNRNLGYRENDVWHWDSEELRKLDNPQLYTLYKELRY